MALARDDDAAAASARAAPSLPAGTTVAARYVLGDVIGAGASGVVYAARDLRLERPVAVKVLVHGQASTGSGHARMEREAKATARLRSPHVVQVLDVCATDAGVPCIVTELLEGRSLDAELAARGALTFAETARFLGQACEAVGEAHTLGIVHRDLKPANLFLVEAKGSRDRTLKVLDFGISKVLPTTDVVASSITREGALVGTPAYMAPEQLTTDVPITPATDVWALGVLLQELLSGRRPFEAGSFPQLYSRILDHRPAPFRPVDAACPADMMELITRCLAKDPAERFADATALGAALAAVAATERSSARSTVSAAARSARTSSGAAPAPRSEEVTVTSQGGRAPHLPGPWRVIGTAAGAFAVAFALLVGALAWGPATTRVEHAAPSAVPPLAPLGLEPPAPRVDPVPVRAAVPVAAPAPPPATASGRVRVAPPQASAPVDPQAGPPGAAATSSPAPLATSRLDAAPSPAASSRAETQPAPRFEHVR